MNLLVGAYREHHGCHAFAPACMRRAAFLRPAEQTSLSSGGLLLAIKSDDEAKKG
jgi:hypothetical protein